MDDSTVLARGRQYARYLNMLSWAHPSPQPKRILIGSAIFAQLTAESYDTLQWDAAFSP